MKKTVIKSAAAVGVCLALAVGAVSAGAAGFGRRLNNEKQPEAPGGAPQQEMQFNCQQPGGMQMQFAGQQPGGQPMDFGGMQMQQGGSFGMQPMMPNQQMGGFGQNSQQPTLPGQQNGAAQSSASEAGEVVAGVTSNSAMNLEADYANAVTYTMTDENNSVKITGSGTYIVTGSSADGNITVKKGTTGVVLVLKDLDLASSAGAAVSLNKESEVKVIIEGTVTLTDNENPADEESTDADVADAYDGAALKVKANAAAYITGSGTLNIVGNAKNGIKGGDDAGIVIDGVTLNITAANDGINVNYDLAILSGAVTVSASDDAIHADHILTIGAEGTNPTVTVKKSTEGLEGTVVNLASGKITINSSDDAINAANADGAYEGVLGYSVNVTGGSVTIISGGDGVDSNGNVNLISGTMSIRSANNGGEAGIDYDGSCYVSPDFVLNNQSGVSGPDMMGGMMGGMPGGMGNMGSFGGQKGGFRR